MVVPGLRIAHRLLLEISVWYLYAVGIRGMCVGGYPTSRKKLSPQVNNSLSRISRL